MTGFGEATVDTSGLRYQLEIRALNSRYLKTNIKLPEELAFLETRVDKLLRERISRGTIHYTLRVNSTTAEAPSEIHAGVLQDYLRQLDPALEELKRRGVTLDLSALLLLPGVCDKSTAAAAEHEAVWAAVRQISVEALEKMRAMRAEEGKALAADLLSHCERIERLLAGIRDRTPQIVEQYSERLRQRVESLLAGTEIELDADALLREVAIFAERCDVAEEISRLDSHLQQFREMLDSADRGGRTLEFIAQEMLREANTIGSKANDSTVSRTIVEVKGAIDRIKEQTQNVE